MLAGPALVGVLYRLQVGKPVILHSIPSRGKGFFFSFQECPDLFCGPPNFLFSGNWGPKKVKINKKIRGIAAAR